MEYNRNMREKTWKLLSELLLSIAIGIVLSIFVLVIYQFQSFKLFSISFFLTLIVISMSLYCLNFLGKYGFSLKRIEFVSIAISLCITLLYQSYNINRDGIIKNDVLSIWITNSSYSVSSICIEET